MLTILVTGAGGNIGANMIQALREWDRPVQIVGTEANDYYGFLSEADNTYQVPPASDDTYYDHIEDIIERESIDVVLPSNGWEVEAISQSADRLNAATALPKTEAVTRFQNKWRLYQILENTEVPTPKTTLVENRLDVEAALAASPTDDVWVRGIGIKDYPGRKMQDSNRIADRIDSKDGWGRSTVSAYLQGDDLTWLGIFDRGSLVCSQGRQRLDYGESQSWGTGAPTVSRTVHRDDLNKLGERSIKAVDKHPHGVYFTDFRTDKAGIPHVTEVNPGRLGTTSSAFYLRAGLNLTALLIQIALEEAYDTPPKYDALPADLNYISKAHCNPTIVTTDEIENQGFGP